MGLNKKKAALAQHWNDFFGGFTRAGKGIDRLERTLRTGRRREGAKSPKNKDIWHFTATYMANTGRNGLLEGSRSRGKNSMWTGGLPDNTQGSKKPALYHGKR